MCTVYVLKENSTYFVRTFGSLLDCQAAQAWLATSKLPQPRVNLIDVAATPASSAAESAQPAGKHEFLFLLYL